MYYTEYKEEKDIERLLYDGLRESFDKMRTSYSAVGLMLSEGADSRLLVVLAKATGVQD